MSKYHTRRVSSKNTGWKKMAINFGLTPQFIIAEAFKMGCQLNSAYRYIRGNITWRKDPIFHRTIAQVAFASSDEPKLMRIINKFGGKIIPLKDNHQRGIEETTLSGKTLNIELVDEYIGEDFRD